MLIFPERREIAWKLLFFSWRWRCHDVLTAFLRRSYGVLFAILRRPWGFYKAPWRFYCVLVGDCLRSHSAATACFELSQRVHSAFTALPLRWWHFVCIPCWNPKVTSPWCSPAWWCTSVMHSIFPKPKSCIYQAGINNTLLIPLTQICFKKSSVSASPYQNLVEVTLTNKYSLLGYSYWKCSQNLQLIPFYVIQN